MILKLKLKNHYLIYNIDGNNVKTRVADVVEEIVSIESFDRKTGIVEFKWRGKVLNQVSHMDTDWLDIKDDLKFLYENPMDIIGKIEKVVIEK